MAEDNKAPHKKPQQLDSWSQTWYTHVKMCATCFMAVVRSFAVTKTWTNTGNGSVTCEVAIERSG